MKTSSNNVNLTCAFEVQKQMIDAAINEGKNVYIKGIPVTANDKFLLSLVKSVGHVVSVKAILEQTSHRLSDGQLITIEGKCKGYGFIMFESSQYAYAAIAYLNGSGYQASLAKSSFSSQLKMLQDSDSTNLYLFNLPVVLDEDGLANYINKEVLLKDGGKVVSVKILRNSSGISRQAGFARVDSRRSAELCINKLSGVLIPGCVNPIQVRYADNYAQKDLKNLLARKWNSTTSPAPISTNTSAITSPTIPSPAIVTAASKNRFPECLISPSGTPSTCKHLFNDKKPIGEIQTRAVMRKSWSSECPMKNWVPELNYSTEVDTRVSTLSSASAWNTNPNFMLTLSSCSDSRSSASAYSASSEGSWNTGLMY